MSDRYSKVIGYFAYASPTKIVCTGKACVISGSQHAMRYYIAEIDPEGWKKNTIKKTRFGEIMRGLQLGAAYAFDKVRALNFYEIKQAILNLTDKDFVQFEEWFYKLGNKRLAKEIQLNEVRQAVLSLSNKDFDHFEDWFEDLCDERWAEEVKNDPMAQEAIKIGNLIMSKPDPGKYLADLLSGNEAKDDE